MELISKKKRSVALVLCFFFGLFGFHHFYVWRIEKGIIYIFTMGFFTIGIFADLYFILSGKFKDRDGALLKYW